MADSRWLEDTTNLLRLFLPSAIGYTLRLRKKGSSATVAFLSLWQKAPGDVMGKRVWAREFRNNMPFPLHSLHLTIFSLSGTGLAEDHLQQWGER